MVKCIASRFFVVGIVLVLSAGCASTGQDVSDDALGGDPTAMRSDGAKMTSRGDAAILSGEKILAQGRKRIAEGESMVARGGDLVASARFDYQTKSKTLGSATSPKAVADEAKALKALSTRWEDAIDLIRDGNKLIEKGNQNLNEGEAQIRKGRALVEQGSTLIRESENARLQSGEPTAEEPSSATSN